MSKFSNLHQHTVESHLDAICDIDALFDRAKELGQPSLAITDHGSMGGVFKAWKASQRTGVKLIPGNEIYFVTNLDAKSKKDEGWQRYHLVLLAMNEVGYKNLLRITYEGFKHSIHINIMNKTFPRVDASILSKYNEGLFALSACGGNIIAQSILKENHDEAVSYAKLLKDIFGDRFYIELQPHNMSKLKKVGDDKVVLFDQKMLNDEMKRIAEENDIGMVVTCDAHYIKKEDEKYHDMILAINDKKSLDDLERHRYTSQVICDVCQGKALVGEKCSNPECVKGITAHKLCAEFYLKSEEEIREMFNDWYGKDFTENVISNVEFIANKCESPDYMAPTGKEHIPTFGMNHISQCPDFNEFKIWRKKKPALLKAEDDIAYLKFLSWKGFCRYTKDFDKEKKDKYWKQMCFEIEVYASRGFASYMLIVADYIRWARSRSILVGSGRGSVGGSLVAFFLGIHKVDPIKYNLLFERFVNLYKKSLPDVDTDFAPSGRDAVYNYVKDKYGEENVAFISNLNRFTPKVVITDVIRSYLVDKNKSDAFRLAKEVTAEISTKATLEDGRIIEVDTMDKAVKYSTGTKLAELLKVYPELYDYAQAIVGLPRNYSTHAAGVVISDIPLPDFVPVRRDKKGDFAVQYEKSQVEENGLVKMDFLGLTTLDIIDEIIKQSERLGIKLKSFDELDEYTTDPGAYKIISSGAVIGCFQIEGSTLQPLCKPMRPKSIDDIAFVNALGRPNCSKKEREEFLNRRDGKSEIVPPHPVLKDILQHTYGISIYEEDLLRLAQHVAGWNLSEADQLRKLTKLKEKGGKLAEELEDKFIEGCMKTQNLSKKDAKFIWNKVVIPYSKYGFNRAHAIAYSITGYKTAYYKYHARSPFFAAVLNSKLRGGSTPESGEKINEIKKDAQRFGVKIDVCDINHSKEYYVAATKNRIVTGLGAIKGVGETILKQIIDNQPYQSFEDFVIKNLKKVNKNHVAALAKAGAFDTLGVSRKFAHEHFDTLKKELKSHLKKKDDTFFEMGDRNKPLADVLSDFTYSEANKSKDDWSYQERLIYEKEVLGEYVSGSPMDLFPGFFKGGEFNLTLDNLRTKIKNETVCFEGVITSVNEFVIKNGSNSGKTYARMMVENLKGETIEVTAWSEVYSKYKSLLGNGDVPVVGIFKVSDFKGEKGLIMTDKVKIGKRKK